MKIVSPDVAVIGAGPVGCVTALAFARRGAKVTLLEAQPNNKKRLAGEWLHPPALEVLERLGVSLSPDTVNYDTGLGFVVFPDDGSKPIRLEYPSGAKGLSCEHNSIVSTLREAASDRKEIDFISHARVTRIQGQQLSVESFQQGDPFTVVADRIVGADGRASIARKAMGISHNPQPISYMAGVLLENVKLPFEGFGHVLLGGVGPALIYRIGENKVRMCLDVPLNVPKKLANLWDAYRSIIPSELLEAFRQALAENRVVWVANQHSSRTYYGRPGLSLVGDATGYFHPMTATGMTVGFMDAERLVESHSFKDYQNQRNFGTYVPEMLATTLYQVFCRDDESAVAIRRAIYQMWREDPTECFRTMHLLSGAQTNIFHFTGSFIKGLAMAVKSVFENNIATGQWLNLLRVSLAFAQWLRLPMTIAVSRFWKNPRGSMSLKEGV
ncbi:MAG: FAD-dependent oxidoreductase [Hormoscilla sp. GM102CHS1]|nr:FAD-dependent oxidoreductase [Hormoscilla sp. GM102CHS1]